MWLFDELKQRDVEPEMRLVDVLHGETKEADSKRIIEQFTRPDSWLRVVSGTLAFGIGVDPPNVRNIRCWGVPKVNTMVNAMKSSGKC